MRDAAKDQTMRAEINALVADAPTMQPDAVFARARELEKRYLYDPDFDASGLDITQLFLSFYETHGLYEDALRVYRRACALRGVAPFDNNLFYVAAISESGARAETSDFTTDPNRVRSSRSVLIAGAPKSGTTFLESTLIELTGMPFVPFNLDYSLYTGTLVPQMMVSQLERDVIAKEHCFASTLNIAAIQAMVPYTVVLVRNIFDCLVSMRDMQLQPTIGFTSGFYEDHLAEMNESDQLDAVSSRFASFYIEFFVSWERAIRHQTAHARRWTYEELMADKRGVLGDIISFCDRSFSDAEIEAAAGLVGADRTKSRLNVGRRGRGIEMFSDDQKDRIRALTRFYPDIDFSPIGL